MQCSCGFKNMDNANHCFMCGKLLNEQFKLSQRFGDEEQLLNIFPEDKNLKLLLEIGCYTHDSELGLLYRKSILYWDEQEGNYQLHSYICDFPEGRKHRGYLIDDAIAEKILETLKAAKLKEFDVPYRLPETDSDYVFKFLNEDGKTVYADQFDDDMKDFDKCKKISTMVEKAFRKGKLIVPEYAKNWKEIMALSQGVRIADCYKLEIEKTENGVVRAKGLCFAKGCRHAANDWVTLSEAAAERLSNIPLGLQFSAIDYLGITFMHNNITRFFYITYGDDWTDAKLIDDAMMSEVLEIMVEAWG